MFNPLNGWFWNWFGWIFIVLSVLILWSFGRLTKDKRDYWHNQYYLGRRNKIALIYFSLILDVLIFVSVCWSLGIHFSSYDYRLFEVEYFLKNHDVNTFLILIFLLNLGSVFALFSLVNERTPEIKNYLITVDSFKEAKVSDGILTGTIFVPEICQRNSNFDIAKITDKGLARCDLRIGFKNPEDLKTRWFSEAKSNETEEKKAEDLALFYMKIDDTEEPWLLPNAVGKDKPTCVVNYRGVGSFEFYNMPISSGYLITVTF